MLRKWRNLKLCIHINLDQLLVISTCKDYNLFFPVFPLDGIYAYLLKIKLLFKYRIKNTQ